MTTRTLPDTPLGNPPPPLAPRQSVTDKLYRALVERDQLISELQKDNAELRRKLAKYMRPAPATPESEREAMAQERRWGR